MSSPTVGLLTQAVSQVSPAHVPERKRRAIGQFHRHDSRMDYYAVTKNHTPKNVWWLRFCHFIFMDSGVPVRHTELNGSLWWWEHQPKCNRKWHPWDRVALPCQPDPSVWVRLSRLRTWHGSSVERAQSIERLILPHSPSAWEGRTCRNPAGRL